MCSMQIHLADTNIPGKDRLQESEALTPGNDLMTFDTGVCSVQSQLFNWWSMVVLAETYRVQCMGDCIISTGLPFTYEGDVVHSLFITCLCVSTLARLLSTFQPLMCTACPSFTSFNTIHACMLLYMWPPVQWFLRSCVYKPEDSTMACNKLDLRPSAGIPPVHQL